MTVANMDFNLLDGGIEIKNTNSYEIKVSSIVDDDNPDCRIASGGVPSPIILKAGESMVVLHMEPGVSFYFEPYYIQPEIQLSNHNG